MALSPRLYWVAVSVISLALMLLAWPGSTVSLRHRSAAPAHPMSSSRYAYVQFAADTESVCHAAMMAAQLRRLEVTGDLVVLYADDGSEDMGRLLDTMAKRNQVKSRKTEVLATVTGDNDFFDQLYGASGLKLQVMSLFEYDKIIFVDSDAVVLKNMDHLFSLPSSPIAIPAAYWLPQPWYSAQIIVIEPSKRLYGKMLEMMRDPTRKGYDMEYMNWLCGVDGLAGSARFDRPSCMILPHRGYNMLTSTLKGEAQDRYIGALDDVFDAQAEYDRLHYAHFSGQTKPWRFGSDEQVYTEAPSCADGTVACAERKIWLDLSLGFRRQRREVCGW